MSITIKNDFHSVQRYIADVCAGADSAKEELGFFPHLAYKNAAISGKLYVATLTFCGIESYVGHLMFGGMFPQAKIFQLFVSRDFRGHGIARQLVTCLKKNLTMEHWLSIVANVADNLAANSTWERMGFQIIRTKAGGVARKRQINVRALDLETPSLLTMMRSSSRAGELRFIERYSHRPVYLFDLNVLFDVIRQRPRSDAAATVVWAGMANNIRLMVADEFTKELIGTSKNPDGDPVLAFASLADRLPPPPEKEAQAIVAKLALTIFPERHQQGILTKRDTSDLRHIATAIHHKVAGFITSEKAILRVRPHLLETWRIDVIGVEEFSKLVNDFSEESNSAVVQLSNGTLRTSRNQQEDLPKAQMFLQSMKASASFSAEALNCQGSQTSWLLVSDEQGIPLGFVKWDSYGGAQRTADVYLIVDEATSVFESILDHILDRIPRELSSVSPTMIRLHIANGHIATRKIALSMGFLPPLETDGGQQAIQRLALGRLVTPDKWLAVRQSLISAASLTLPLCMPTSKQACDQVMLKTREREVGLSLAEIESALAPALFLFHGRGGVIVPIRAHFARDLFGADPQYSFLAPPEAILRNERVYISAPKTVKQFQPGTPILFYESQKFGGRGCVFAIARITGSRLITKVNALNTVLRRGVLNDRSLEQRSVGKTVTETSFDNVFLFKSPVSLERLRKLGCVDGAHLVTAKAISFDKLITVVKEGGVDD